MGRAEKRKKAKYVSKKLTPGQFAKLENDINKEFINDEVNNQTAYFRKLFSECLKEAFKKNSVSEIKALMILDDVELIMIRKVEEKKNGKS
ncbi:hypothetical protein ACQPU1_06425 [Clostridium paraputrificum]|uniref:hypothetical protein n=1 Tax=Clostridium paraputrificum TaxID=29363 RepID=UPI003D3582BB